MTTQKIIHALYGCNSRDTTNPIVAQVQIISTLILRSNPNRVAVWMTNNSANAIYVLDNQAVTANLGFLIEANGGFWKMDVFDDFHAPTNAWYAIAIGGVSNITLKEIITTS